MTILRGPAKVSGMNETTTTTTTPAADFDRGVLVMFQKFMEMETRKMLAEDGALPDSVVHETTAIVAGAIGMFSTVFGFRALDVGATVASVYERELNALPLEELFSFLSSPEVAQAKLDDVVAILGDEIRELAPA